MLVLAIPGWGQSTVEDIDQLRARMRDAQTSPARVPNILDQVLSARASLLAGDPENADTIFWRTAQVEDFLFGLRFDALEQRVRYGLPSTQDEQRLQSFLEGMLGEIELIEDRLPLAEAQAEDGSLRAARLATLRLTDLPRLKATAIELAAARGVVGLDQLAEAVEVLTRLQARARAIDQALIARRRGQGLIRLGRLEEARRVLDDAMAVPELGVYEQIALQQARLNLRKAEFGILNAAGNAQMLAATSPNPTMRLLLVEHAARLWMEASRQEFPDQDPEETRREYEAAATEVFLLLAPESGGIRFPDQPRTLDLIIEQRMGRLDVVDPLAPHLPVTVAIARAVPLAVSAETAQQARDLLSPLVDRRGIIPDQRARLMAVLTHADVMAGDRIAGTNRAIIWSGIATDRFEAHDAAELAAKIATDLWRRSPSDSQLRALAGRAIENLIVNFDDHPEVNQWRLQNAELFITQKRWADAREALTAVDAESPERIRALARFGQIVVGSLDGLNEADRARAVTGGVRELERYKAEVQRLAAGDSERSNESMAILELCLAQMELRQNKPFDALQRLFLPVVDTISPSLRPAVDLTRIRAALGNDRPATVRSVVAMVNPKSQKMVAEVVLQELLQRLGPRLPSDPLEDPVAVEGLVRLGEMLYASAPEDLRSRMLIAEAFRRGGLPQRGLLVIEDVLATDDTLADAVFIKAECLRDLPETDEAEIIPLYTRLITATSPEINHGRFWTAQVRLLESMRDHGRDAQEIIARINRLKQQWPELGGMPWQGRLLVVEGQLTD